MLNLKTIISQIRLIPKKDGQTIEITDLLVLRDKLPGGMLKLTFPLLGNLVTICRTDQITDEMKAVDEALRLFFKTINEHGNGIRVELKSLGWELKTDQKLRFRVSENDPINSIVGSMNAHKYSEKFNVAA